MATTKEKNVIGIAKGTTSRKKPVAKKTTRKPAAKKSTTKKIVEPVLTPAQERDLKAKAKVEELLEDVQLTLNKEEELLVLEETPEEPKGVEWLEEQMSLLTQDNERLKAENQVLLAENSQFQVGGTTPNDAVIVNLFEELQQNHLKMGVNPQTNVGNFRIYCPGFLNRMIKFFPFLEQYKKY